jgi:hypothetical protein
VKWLQRGIREVVESLHNLRLSFLDKVCVRAISLLWETDAGPYGNNLAGTIPILLGEPSSEEDSSIGYLLNSLIPTAFFLFSLFNLSLCLYVCLLKIFEEKFEPFFYCILMISRNLYHLLVYNF